MSGETSEIPQDPSWARPGLTLLFSGGLVIGAALVFWDATTIRPSRFEPLGPAPMPLFLSAAIGLLSLTVFAATLLRVRATSLDMRAECPDPTRVIFFAMMLVYGVVLETEVIRYDFATAIFLTLSVMLLSGWRPMIWAVAAVASTGLAFAIQYVFTRVFIVDLPGVF